MVLDVEGVAAWLVERLTRYERISFDFEDILWWRILMIFKRDRLGTR